MASTTFSAILSHLTYFLTVAIHTILAERNCYPIASFMVVRAYNLPVRQSRHPDVCAWIQSAVTAVRTELLKGTVAGIVLALAHPDTSEILERYVFDLEKLPSIAKEDLETPIVWTSNSDESFDQRTNAPNDPQGPGGDRQHELVDLTEQLRATLASIAVSRRRLRPIPEGCPFTVAIELKDDADAPIGHPQPWIPVEPDLQRVKGNDASKAASNNGILSQDQERTDEERQSENKRHIGSALGGQRTIPMRAVDVEGFAFELWVEEGHAKGSIQNKT